MRGLCSGSKRPDQLRHVVGLSAWPETGLLRSCVRSSRTLLQLVRLLRATRVRCKLQSAIAQKTFVRKALQLSRKRANHHGAGPAAAASPPGHVRGSAQVPLAHRTAYGALPPPTWCLHQPPRAISLLDVYKEHVLIATHTVDQKAFYLIGRNAAVCDIVLSHCSISRLHATIVHHEKGATYLVDLGSAHGTFVDGLRLTALQPTLVVHGAVLTFGVSSRSYTFKAFESREQIAQLLRNRVGLPHEELQLQQNTLLNSQISHRLELSPSRRSLPPMFPMAPVSPDLQPQAATEDSLMECDRPLLGLAGFAPVRKRSRGQSGNSQASGSSDQSGSTADLSVYLDDPTDEQQGEPKRVHFCGQPPEIIPDSCDESIEIETDAGRVREELRRTELANSD